MSRCANSSLVLVSLLLPACTSDSGVTVYNQAPTAEITSHADGDSPEEGQRSFTGVVNDPDHDIEQLTLTWLYDGAEACPPVQPDANGITSCEIFLDSGERTVSLQVVDELGGLASDKVTLDVQPYGDPWAQISSPEAGVIYYSDQLVDFIGQVGDEADAPVDLVAWWESDGELLEVDAEPDEGGNLIGSGYLDEGEHQLVLKVRNTGGNEEFDSVTVTVGAPNSAPTCGITAPETGHEVEHGEVVTFEGWADDVDVSANLLTASWSSLQLGETFAEQVPDSDGTFLLSYDDLPIDVHNITLTVTDDQDAVCSTSIVLAVLDCSTIWYADDDGDGFGDAASTTTGCEQPTGYVEDRSDCDDGDAAVNPDGSEVCNGIDDDCDGDVDDADSSLDSATASSWYADSDGDGYGDAGSSVLSCDQPSGYLADATDCDDADAAAYPSAPELCDGHDDDCDGTVDEDDALDAATWYEDRDGDGYGDALSSAVACSQPTGFVATTLVDCDDSDAAISPAGTELCDGDDNDCDGAVDEADAADASTWYADADSDGYGDAGSSVEACTVPSGHVADASDCDDGSASTHPGADEYCDGVDSDCDGALDEQDALDASTWYADADSDGYGDPLTTELACTAPSSYVSDDTDCDDADGAVNVAATESCNGYDDDCDGDIDDDDSSLVGASAWYADADGDGYGDASVTTTACFAPSGFRMDATDCDDSDASVNPSATEVCNEQDDDCDGLEDDDDGDRDLSTATTWYMDADSDGYGDGTTATVACDQPSGMVVYASDCDDTDLDVNPAANERCDGYDNDCDGDIDEDEALDAQVWYLDSDSDGFGDAAVTTMACDQPSGFASNDDDCDDGTSAISPVSPDLYGDGIDNNCDGEDGVDADGDGYASGYSGGADCDDTDPSVWPGATEIWYDGVDSDCDGWSDYDADGDGYDSEDWAGSDCDDGDSAVNPSATEYCDGIDDDCDGAPDDGACVLYALETGSSGYDDIYITDIIGTGTSNLTNTSAGSESSARPSPDRENILYKYAPGGTSGAWWVMDRYGASATELAPHSHGGYEASHGAAWASSDYVFLNRDNGYYDYLTEGWHIDSGYDQLIIDHAQLNAMSSCCGAEYILHQTFTDETDPASSDFVITGVESVEQTKMDVFGVSTAGSVVTTIHADAGNNKDDHSTVRVSRDGTRVAWTHADGAGWPGSDWQIVATDVDGTGSLDVLLETGSDGSYRVVDWGPDDSVLYVQSSGILYELATDGTQTLTAVLAVSGASFCAVY